MRGYVQVDVDILVSEDDYDAAKEIIDTNRPKEKSNPITKTEIIIGVFVIIIFALLIFLTLEK